MKRRLLFALGVILLVLLPLAIAAAAGVYAYRSSPAPPELQRATIVVTPPSTIQESASAVNLFIADIGEQVQADPMVQFVLDQVGVLNEGTYLENLSAERRGTTSLVELSFVHFDPTVAQTTVDFVARRLLDEAARGEFERTQFLLGRATERLEVAQQGLADFFGSESVFDPDFEYRTALDQVAQLNQQITTGEALAYGETYLAQLAAERDRIESELPRLGEAMLTFQRLSTDLDLAQTAWQEATVNNDRAEFDYLTVNAVENLIASRDVAPFVDDTPRLQRTALAAVVALALALLVVTPISNRLRRGSRRGRHKLSAEGGSDAESDLTIVVDTTDREAERQEVLYGHPYN
ncbi:MAG: hypothetical protein ACR2ME_11240 [Acidimicrobiia bacterium]